MSSTKITHSTSEPTENVTRYQTTIARTRQQRETVGTLTVDVKVNPDDDSAEVVAIRHHRYRKDRSGREDFNASWHAAAPDTVNLHLEAYGDADEESGRSHVETSRDKVPLSKKIDGRAILAILATGQPSVFGEFLSRYLPPEFDAQY